MDITSLRPSATSRALFLPEILDVVVLSLRQDRSRGSLAALAATCQAFNRVTIPRLWEIMNSIVPLFRTFPLDTWTVVKDARGASVLELLRRPTSHEWARFHYYAYFVKQLNWANRQDITDRALEEFGHFLPAHRLLPRLQVLIWLEHRVKYFPLIQIFLGKHLRKLRFLAPLEATGPAHTASMLGYLERESPDLESLEICPLPAPTVARGSGTHGAAKLGDAVARYLRLAPGLHEVRVPEPFAGNYLFSLAALPSLTKLELTLTDDILRPFVRGGGSVGFAQLEHLALDLTELTDDTEAFLGALATPELKQVHLKVHDQPPARVLAAHLRELGRWAHALNAMHVQIEEAFYIESVADAMIDLRTLAPVLELGALRSLLVHAPLLQVDGAGLGRIAKALPRLKLLSLINHTMPDVSTSADGAPAVAPPDPDPYRIPLETLLDVAERCRELETLEVRVDAGGAEIPCLASLEEKGVGPQRALRNLTAYDAPIRSAEAVAAFLRAVFPGMEYVGYVARASSAIPREEKETYMERWDLVSAILRA